METAETQVIARLLAMGSLALVAFAVVLTVGLAGVGSATELAFAIAIIGLVIAAAVACFNASVHFGRMDSRPRDRVYHLVPERVKR